jgi:hypothetical protein
MLTAEFQGWQAEKDHSVLLHEITLEINMGNEQL